jgi:hypothetical protein
VAPLVDGAVEVELAPEVLEIDTYRAPSAGRQHVNKTASAVRITKARHRRWGSQIRSYVLRPYTMVKDQRERGRQRRPAGLHGDVDEFVRAELLAERAPATAPRSKRGRLSPPSVAVTTDHAGKAASRLGSDCYRPSPRDPSSGPPS